MKVTILTGLLLLVLIVVISLVLSYPVMLLWNYCLVPAVNGISTISLLQAWGIMILVRMLTSKIDLTTKK